MEFGPKDPLLVYPRRVPSHYPSNTIRSLVHSQIAGPAPHPVIRCKLLSLSSHVLQGAESVELVVTVRW